MKLANTFRELFFALHRVGYRWALLTPDQYLSWKRDHMEVHQGLQRFVAGWHAGHEESTVREELLTEGLSEEAANWMIAQRPLVHWILGVPGTKNAWGNEGFYVIHHHPLHAEAHSNFAYCGVESEVLLRGIRALEHSFSGKKVLDLGSGAGALAFGVQAWASEILGIEIQQSGVEWAQAVADAQGWSHLSFLHGKIGDRATHEKILARSAQWDIAICNPPLAIPSGKSRPHRDGGRMGIEIPLLFLSAAAEFLRPGGEFICVTSSPVVKGKSLWFDAIERGPEKAQWTIEERKLVDAHFNQSLYRKEGYAQLGVERVELWFVRLRKRG